MASEYLLGISAFYHDSAACLLAGDSIVAAAQEERFFARTPARPLKATEDHVVAEQV